ncbi:hypothetical protein ACIQJX_35075 [Streptomyces griseoviridis]
MADHEQSYGDWRAEQHRRSQAHAVLWAERATTSYETATRHEDDARRHDGNAYMQHSAAEDRRNAAIHGARSAEAIRLAEMWSRVAVALAETGGQHPAT